jgi:hypothetical protein
MMLKVEAQQELYVLAWLIIRSVNWSVIRSIDAYV